MNLVKKVRNSVLLTIFCLSSVAADEIKSLVTPISSTYSTQSITGLNNDSNLARDESVIRTGKIQFNASALNSKVVLANQNDISMRTAANSQPTLFSLEVFKDKVLNIELSETKQHADQAISYVGKTLDSESLNVVMVITQKTFNLTISEENSVNEYHISGLLDQGFGNVKELDMSKIDGVCGVDHTNTALSSHTMQHHSKLELQSFRASSARLNEATLAPENRVRVDLLFLYDNDAQNWVNSDYNSDFQAFTLVAQEKLNSVAANSKLNIEFRVVSQMLVDSNTNNGFGNKLSELNAQRSDLSKRVLAERNRSGADLVVYLAKPNLRGGELGIANLANRKQGYQAYAHSVNAVNRALGTTVIHELGHNFGAGHSRQQGNAGYGGPNTSFSSDAGGMYLEVPHNVRQGNGYYTRYDGYHTIMAYNFYATSGGQNFYEDLNQFSSPQLKFEGELIGDLDNSVAPHKSANNRGVLILTSPYIAQYRGCKVDCNSSGDTYRVSVANPSNGALSCSPLSGKLNTLVRCTATPDQGYVLNSWTGKCAGTTGLSCQFNLKFNVSIGVSFKKQAIDTYSVTKNNPANGSLACSPMTGVANTLVTCTATPINGYVLDAWSGKCQGVTQHTCQFRLNQDENINVSFKKKATSEPRYFDLEIPYAIYNGRIYCTPFYNLSKNEAVTCTAYPNRGYEIEAWLGGCENSDVNSRQCRFNATYATRFVGVKFKKKTAQTFKVSFNQPANGSLSCSPTSGVANTVVNCKATPDSNYELEAWSGKCAGNSNLNCQFYLQKNESIGVSFKKSSVNEPSYFDLEIPYAIYNGSIYCNRFYGVRKNQTVTCTAYPRWGYRVDTWLGACKNTSPNSRQCQFKATYNNRYVGVSFKPNYSW